LCVSGEKVGISCMEQVDAGHGFDAATCGSIPDGVVAVYGLVPDAAQDVRLSLANGTTLAGDVQGNYLYAEVPVTSPDELPTSVSWPTADGDESYRVPASVPQTCARD
jgi:hypothetical protein